MARAVLVIPEGFGRDLAAGETAPVQLLLDGADATTAQTVLGYARALVAEQNARLVAAAWRGRASEPRPRIAYEPRVWYNPELAVDPVPGARA